MTDEISGAGEPDPPPSDQLRPGGGLGLVLTGGGARAAYQVGLLRWLAREIPELWPSILTGVSAGAINAVAIAQHHGTFAQAIEELTHLWLELTPERVFKADAGSLTSNILRSALRLGGGGLVGTPQMRGMVDTSPLRRFLGEALKPVDGELTGIDYNLHRGRLDAVALSTTSYTTGQSRIWVQGSKISAWERANRRSTETRLTLDHVMASAALPIFFPAVQIGNEWYGDGGIRLTAPLSPALHLGARKILTISPRYSRSSAEADRHTIPGYPPPAQIMGVLLNAIFLDVVEQDVARLEMMNALLREVPKEKRRGMRIVDVMVLRPSRDLGQLASAFEPKLPRFFRFLSRGLGTRETSSSDLLSMIMFQRDYIRELINIGEADAEAQGDELRAFFGLPFATRLIPADDT